jgi:hypothetical protein
MWHYAVDHKSVDGHHYEFCAYLWVGSKASNESRAFAVAQLHRVCRGIEASPNSLGALFALGNTSLSDYV